MKILSVSDEIDPFIYSKTLLKRHQDVEFILSCGDLSYHYLEYIHSVLNKPLYFVHGNHDPILEFSIEEPRSYPHGGINLHRRHLRNHKLLFAGVEGSILYNNKSPFQYNQSRMWNHVLTLVPGLLLNKILFGRFLDIFITHAPPKGIHEGSGWTHQGINAFRFLIDTFQPAYHFHGHIHYYRPDDVSLTQVGKTTVINTYRSKITEIDIV